MNTQFLNRKNIRYLLLATALPTLWSTTIKNSSAKFVQIPLSIQTSKMDPPRIAFDEINANFKVTAQISEPTSMNLNETPKVSGSLFNRKVVLSSMVFSKEETAQELEKFQSTQRWVDTLSPSERQRIQAANDKFGGIDLDSKAPTFKEMVQQKLEEIHQEESKQVNPASKVIVQGTEPLQKSDVQVKTERSGFEVSGEFILRGLPPPSANWHVHIARYDDDVKKEDASVDTRLAMYKIRVPELSGSIQAQLIDSSSGLVIGEGNYRLSQYVANQISGKAKIVIEPARHVVSNNYRSFYNQGKSVPGTRTLMASVGTETTADTSGHYLFEGIKSNSWVLTRTETKGYYSGMNLTRSGQEKDVILYPEKMIQALQQIVTDQAYASEYATNGSVVWGRVHKDGKPMAGAEVDVEFLENHKPVYFNALMLPDPSLKATSENGYFAFLNVPEGFRSIVASQNQAYISHANVVVDEKTISTANIEVTSLQEKANVKVFDGFAGTPQRVTLEMQGVGQSLDVDAYAEVNLSPVSRLSLMRVQPIERDFVETTQIYEDNMDSIHVPLVRGSWLQAMMARKKVNSHPNTGTVVAFVSESSYEMYLGHVENFPRENMVFFDAQGEPTEGSVAGGGVIIFNVPVGVQSMVVAENTTNLLQSQVAPVDAQSVTVLKFR